ncbi:hypothetical protein G6F32_015144 [Rhizopus arrhizus]|nr:hypothetical protein G6F32_015144 [Rhizopus arrhizus]
MVRCPECGNKRCPRATDNRNACSGSNELGQAGSAYTAHLAPQRIINGAIMKVSELEGPKLDYWVAQANILNGGAWEDIELRTYGTNCWTLHDCSDGMTHGWITENILDSIKIRLDLNLGQLGFHFWPSVDWQHGGPIIQSERITISTHEPYGDEAWRALHMRTMLTGPTPLIAAMRAYVASKYGEEVSDE